MKTREQMVQEIMNESLVRDAIRGILKEKFTGRMKQFIRESVHTENMIRNVCRSLLKENRKSLLSEKIEDIPHNSTGINVLEDLLEKIIPIIEDDYKNLTSDKEQRKSFRAHIINGVKNTLAPLKVNAQTDGLFVEDQMIEDDLNVVVGGKTHVPAVPVDKDDDRPKDPSAPENQPEFIDIEKKKKDKEADEYEGFAIPGEDETGRNFALITFKKIEKQIQEAYGLLASDEDRDLFYEFLMSNLKLYFDKFESELETAVAEPYSQSYEDAKKDSK